MTSELSSRVNAARAAIQAGRIEDAGALADRVLAEAPDNLDAIEVVALVALERGDHPGAEKALRTAISLSPQRRWPYADLTRLLLKLGRDNDAEEIARSALAADPGNPDPHAMLGSMLAGRELWVAAAHHFELAIELVGRHPQLLTGLGLALLRQERLNEAKPILRAAIGEDPSALEPSAYLAEVYERLGDLESAAAELDRAEVIARTQGTDVDLQRSVLLGRMGKPDEAEALLDRGQELSGAAYLQRGRLRERLGKFAEAWEDWVTGKALLAERSRRRYDAGEVRRQARLISSLWADLAPAPPRTDVPQPVFIVGFPRSGTTLTEQVLASHTAVLAGGELPFGSELHEFVRAGTNVSVAALRDLYLSRAQERGLLELGASHFTDKMPDNSFWLPLLRRAFPQSPVVLLKRHPLDVLTSVMAHDMTHGFNCGYRLEDAATHLALTDELLDHYRSLGAGPTHELRYEALVANQVGETERMMAAIGLNFEPGQLNFQDRTSVSPTPSYAQVREPLNDRSIGRWRNFTEQLKPVHALIVLAMNRGGYAG